jgi:hypothetical protein
MARFKLKHYVDTDKIYHVEFIQKRGGSSMIRFTAMIDGQKGQAEISEEEYGKMLQNGYYET